MPLFPMRSGAARLAGLFIAPAFMLGGCVDLPSSGPTAGQIAAGARGGPMPFAVVDLTRAQLEVVPPAPSLGVLAASPGRAEVDLIGPGDVLQISVFEVGAALFAGRSLPSSIEGIEAPTAAGQALPPLTVDRDGNVLVPYVGPVRAAGLTPNALAARIQAGLANKSQAPQVTVNVHEPVASTVVVMGDVKKPGRLPLTLARERLLDAVALSGGALNPEADELVRLTRGDVSAVAVFATIKPGAPDDIELRPQDRLELEYRPRTYSVYGAAGKVQEIPFQSPRVSLAEALARAGGPSEQQADPAAVFVFRYEPSGPDGAPQAGARPVAYRLNLMQAQSYLLAQRFEMRSRDVIYVANARSNQPAKLLQILNLFFQPVYTGKVLAQ